MSTALTPRKSALGRAGAWIMRTLRLADAVEKPEEFVAGSDFASNYPSDPTYSQRRAMSAYPANPWLAACINAIATDISGLPLTAAGPSGDNRPTHQALDLFKSPSPGVSGRVFRMQIAADLVLAGNAYLLTLYGVGGEPVSIKRLHPARVRIVPAADGTPAAYEYVGDGVTTEVYAPSAVQHIRGVSWEDDPRSLYGQGVVRPLDRDLVADAELAQASARSAAKGRPDAIYRPAKPDQTWNPAQVRVMKKSVQEMLSASHGGVAVMGGAGVLEMLGWSPKDMEGVQQRTWTRETILAVCGVPPARVGLPNTNYATAEAQMVTYWQSTIMPLAALIDEAFSNISNDFKQPVSTAHDFSGVSVLQNAQTKALERVEKHIANGMDVIAAYEREGLHVDPADFGRSEDQQRAEAEATAAAQQHAQDMADAREDITAAIEMLEGEVTDEEAEEARALLADALQALRPVRLVA